MWLLDLLLNVYTCPSIRDEVLLCKVIYEIIETKENLTQIKMSVRVIAVLLLIEMIRITAHNKCKKWAVLRLHQNSKGIKFAIYFHVSWKLISNWCSIK